MTLVKQVYNCTEDAAYEISRRAIDNLENDLADFFLKSMNYVVAYILVLKGYRTTAMGLPNEDQRNATHEATRNLLPGLMDPIKLNFRAIQGYIRDGWPGEDPNPYYEEAGLLKYNAIGKGNWEAVIGLQGMMVAFVTKPANLAKLTTPGTGGMPAGFALQLGTDYAPFETAYNLFAATLDTTALRNAKVTATNTLVTECKKFMKFGREVVYPKSAKKERYTWEILEKQVDPSQGGIHLTALDVVADVPLEGLECIWKPDGKEAVTFLTAKEGVVEHILEEGEGVLTVKKKGMHVVSKRFKIDPGVKKQVHAYVAPETSADPGEIVLGRGSRGVVNPPAPTSPTP
jgi:hypothetical protein